MEFLSRQFKQILLISCLLFCTGVVFAQPKPPKASHEFKNFSKVTSKVNVAFVLPDGFKELPVNDASPFDYGIGMPDQDFEIWFKIIPQTEATTDSAYVEIGRAEARTLAGDNTLMERGMPDRVLADYGADAGKTFFLNLADLPATRHFKYALLITLQKMHKGTIMAVCFTNDRGPDFFRNINKARNSIRFKVQG
jgi:hypothetical protein